MRRKARRKLQATVGIKRIKPNSLSGSPAEIAPVNMDSQVNNGDVEAPLCWKLSWGEDSPSYVTFSIYLDSVAQSSRYMMETHCLAGSVTQRPGAPNPCRSRRRHGFQSPQHLSHWQPRQPPAHQPPLFGHLSGASPSPKDTIWVTVVDLAASYRGDAVFHYVLACTRAELDGFLGLLAPPGSGRLLALRTGGLPPEAHASWPATAAEFDSILARDAALTVEVSVAGGWPPRGVRVYA